MIVHCLEQIKHWPQTDSRLTIFRRYRLNFMPNSAPPGKILRGGEFYSPVRARVNAADAVLSELCQPVARSMPRHEHELAYVTIMLDGQYLEGDQGKLDELRPFTAVFNPVGATHSTVIGPAGASLFTIEFLQQNLRGLDLRLPERTTRDCGVGAIFWTPAVLRFQDSWDRLSVAGRARVRTTGSHCRAGSLARENRASMADASPGTDTCGIL